MELHIISPLKQWSIAVAWVELNTTVGNFVIEIEHAPTVLTLAAHSAVIFGLENGKQDSMIIVSGLAHIQRDSVTLLLSEV